MKLGDFTAITEIRLHQLAAGSGYIVVL